MGKTPTLIDMWVPFKAKKTNENCLLGVTRLTLKMLFFFGGGGGGGHILTFLEQERFVELFTPKCIQKKIIIKTSK